MKKTVYDGKVSNPAQLGGIETAVLDNGAGRGVRVAWVNTGSPLRYKVVLDRAMDISEAFYGPHSLAWLSRGGVTPPAPVALYDLDWLQAFGGGLVTTCGLSHVGGPETDEHGRRGLHGRISTLPAEVVSIEQPDPERGLLRMALTGVVRETGVFGPHLELRRTISGELGCPEIRITDQVINRGNRAAAHMLLYHCNLGYPLVDEGAELRWDGETRSRGGAQDDAIFGGGHDYRHCPPPLKAHDGFGEACGFIRPAAGADGLSRTGVCNRSLDLALQIEFDARQLPCLANWQHWGEGEYVTGLEPGTHFPTGQKAARTAGELVMLEPGETRDYAMVIRAGAASLWS
jgi:hypothetical protein